MTGGWTKGKWSAHCCDAVPKEGDDGRRFFDILAGEVWKSSCDLTVSGYIAVGTHVASIWGRGDSFEEREANSRLIAEAGTAANETGLSPRQLVEQRAELLGLAVQYRDDLRYPMMDDSRKRRLERVMAVIAKCTGAGTE